jgi:cytoskeletal protein RodZ
MQSVGSKLRAARITAGWSLEDVSARTRITLKTLEAIENDDLGKISSPFLYRSFARQFANDLRLDLGEEIQATAKSMPSPLIPGQAEHPPHLTLPAMRPRKTQGWRFLYSIFSLIVVLGCCSGVYGVWESANFSIANTLASFTRGMRLSAAKSSRVDAHTTFAVSAFSRGLLIPTLEVQRPGELDLPMTMRTTAVSHVELSATEPSWVSIVADGKETFSGTLATTDKKTVDAETVRLKTGNAGALNVVFNGKSIGSIGSPGQVRTLVFAKNRCEVVHPVITIPATILAFSPSGE